MNSVACPHCGQHVINDPALAGQLAECPGCNGVFQIPAVGSIVPPKLSGLKGRFNILHYILVAVLGLFIGGCGGCVLGWGAMYGAHNDPKADPALGPIGVALFVFGPFIGSGLGILLLRRYDLNRTKRYR